MEKIQGQDACIEISLKEQGIAWIEQETDFKFYYGIGHDGREYNRFSFGWFSKDTDLELEFDFVDWESVNSYVGYDIRVGEVVHGICDLVNYYGHDNIFGSTYDGGISFDNVIKDKIIE